MFAVGAVTAYQSYIFFRLGLNDPSGLTEESKARRRVVLRWAGWLSGRRTARSHLSTHIRCGAVEGWLSPAPGTIIEAFDGEPPKPIKGESIIDSVARLERCCRKLRADAHRIESAPFLSTPAKERMREIVATLARWGTECLDVDRHERSEIAWPMRTLQSTILNAEGLRPIAFAEIEAGVLTLAWLFGDVMIAARRHDWRRGRRCFGVVYPRQTASSHTGSIRSTRR